jgi:hypothetical protein
MEVEGLQGIAAAILKCVRPWAWGGESIAVALKIDEKLTSNQYSAGGGNYRFKQGAWLLFGWKPQAGCC